jgi:hypothetical protein
MSPVAYYRSAKTDTGVEFAHGCRRKKGDTRDEDGRKEIASDRGLSFLARIARATRGISGSRKGVNTSLDSSPANFLAFTGIYL